MIKEKKDYYRSLIIGCPGDVGAQWKIINLIPGNNKKFDIDEIILDNAQTVKDPKDVRVCVKIDEYLCVPNVWNRIDRGLRSVIE